MEKLRDLINDNLYIPMTRFCEEIGVSRETIASFLNGRHKGELSFLTIKKICRYFNVDYHDYI